jgi:hypothetical protein
MTGDNLLAVAAKIRAFHDEGPVGALAIVGTDEQFRMFARLLGALAAADRPMKVFTSVRPAICASPIRATMKDWRYIEPTYSASSRPVPVVR